MICIVPRCQRNVEHKAEITGFVNISVGYCKKHKAVYERLEMEFYRVKNRREAKELNEPVTRGEEVDENGNCEGHKFEGIS